MASTLAPPRPSLMAIEARTIAELLDDRAAMDNVSDEHLHELQLRLDRLHERIHTFVRAGKDSRDFRSLLRGINDNEAAVAAYEQRR